MKVICQNKICTFYKSDCCTREEIVLNDLGVCGSYVTTLKLPEEEEMSVSFGWTGHFHDEDE